jgi:hypothetical protein
MVKGLDDMFPTFLGQIDGVAVMVVYCPAFHELSFTTDKRGNESNTKIIP